MKLKNKISLLAVSVLLSGHAWAASTWGVGAFLDGNNASTSMAKNASAWSTTGSGSTLAAACIHNYGSSGYGIVNTRESNPCTGETGTGPHAADNNYGVDMFLLEFAAPVTLAQFAIGWNGTDDYGKDSDVSILAYAPSGSSAGSGPAMAGKTLSGLLSSGWSVVGNYQNAGAPKLAGSGGIETVSTTTTSSWWLVSAYHSTFGSTSQNPVNGTTSLNNGNDYFKLLSVAANQQTPPPPPPEVHEPGSLALMGAGLWGMMALRRRRQNAA